MKTKYYDFRWIQVSDLHCFSFLQRTSFDISCKEGLLATNSLKFCLPKKVFISSHFGRKDYYRGQWILGWWVVLLSTLYLFYFNFNFYFILLYSTVLVLPYLVNTLNIWLSSCLHGFWEVRYNSYLCSSIGKLPLPLWFPSGFFLNLWFSVVWMCDT